MVDLIIRFVFVMTLALPQSALANCVIVDRLAIVQGAMARMYNAPGGRIRGTIDSATITTAMRHLDARFIRQEISPTATTDDIESLTDLVEAAVILQNLMKAKSPEIRRNYMSSSEIYQVLNAAEKGIPRFRCDINVVHVTAQIDDGATSVPYGGETSTTSTSSPPGWWEREVALEDAMKGLILTVLGSFAIWYGVRRWKEWLYIRKRQSKRFNANLSSRLKADGNLFQTTLLDLSCHGGKINVTAPADLDVGHDVQILLIDEWYAAQIVWANPHYLGLQFNTALPISLVRQIATSALQDTKKAAPTKGAARFARLGNR